MFSTSFPLWMVKRRAKWMDFPSPQRLCRNGKKAVIPAKPVPACLKQGVGIQSFKMINIYN